MVEIAILVWRAVQPVLAGIAAIILSAGGITAFAYWLFRTYSTKWLDTKFQKELESFKHEHQIELQRLKLDIDALLDRTIKLHTKEFEVLPEAWRLLDLAFAQTESLERRLFRVSDLNNSSDEDIELILKSSGLSELHQSEIRKAHDKTEMYLRAIQGKHLLDAQKARLEFLNYLMANSIWLQRGFSEQFQEIHNLIHEAFVERQLEFQNPAAGIRSHEKSQTLSLVGTKTKEQLQNAINSRLWSAAERISS